MHQEAMAFLRRTVAALRPPGWVCELGSLDVNGSARELFPGAVYIGVDVRPGKGVDVVADAATWNLGPVLLFDCALSTECLEHAANAREVCANAFRLLRPGGVFLVTTAAPGRGPHSVDGKELPEGEFYANVGEADLREWLADFAVVLTEVRAGVDLYALAIKGI